MEIVCSILLTFVVVNFVIFFPQLLNVICFCCTYIFGVLLLYIVGHGQYNLYRIYSVLAVGVYDFVLC